MVSDLIDCYGDVQAYGGSMGDGRCGQPHPSEGGRSQNQQWRPLDA